MLFNKIFYINLNRRPERNKHIKEQLKKISWKGPIERLPAVDGKYLKQKVVSTYFTETAIAQSTTKHEQFIPGYYMTKGGMGCALSHRQIYLKIQKQKFDRVLILEDDVLLEPNFLEKLDSVSKYIPNDFDILYLGYSESKSSTPVNEYISKPTGVVFGTFAMVINKRVVPKLLSLFPLYAQIDSSISNLFPNIKAYHFHFDKRIIHHVPDPHLNTDVQTMEMYQYPIQNLWIIFVILFFLALIFIF